MSAETLETGPIANPLIQFICWVVRHPCTVKLPSKYTPVTWEEGFRPSGGMFCPDVDDLERNEVEATQDDYSCIKIEDFKRCWCNKFFNRTNLDYEA